MFDKFNVSRSIENLILNFSIDLLNAVHEVSMQYDFAHVFRNLIFYSCKFLII